MIFSRNKKHIVIIGGITGTIGSAFFEQYIFDRKTVIFGISRKGIQPPEQLPEYSSVFSVRYENQEEMESFFKKVISMNPSVVTYIHCMGPFKTELDPITKGRRIHVDNDNDGIDDEIYKNIFLFSKGVAETLIGERGDKKIHLNFVNFGSLVEDHTISIFESWVQVRKMVIEAFKKFALLKDISSIDILVSSVLSITELIQRPYVLGTDNNPLFWIKPEEVATRGKKIIKKGRQGFTQYKLFHRAPNFSKERFDEEKMIKRRLFEHFGLS